MATKRKPTTSLNPSQQSTPIKPTTPPTAMHPLLPTPTEALLISIYPLTLLAGSLFTTLSPSILATDATYSATHQSYQPPHQAPSYFAQKKNIFNLYFVKIGWFWSTAALLLFLVTHPSHGKPLSLTPTASRLRALLRYLGVSAVWALTTQWFFGPPLIDRSFVWSGGSCTRPTGDMGRAEEAWTHAKCKVAGGTWSGGIDISGHVFLIILGSGMLWFELLPVLTRASGLREARRVRLADGREGSAEIEASEVEKEKRVDRKSMNVGVKFVVGVVALNWWMLLMTAAFFHTWSEKLSGLVVAFAGLWAVYFLPRGSPALRSVFGMPGL